MYQGHFSDQEAHFHLGDVHNLSADAIPTVALATASFPCNDLSLAEQMWTGGATLRCVLGFCESS